MAKEWCAEAEAAVRVTAAPTDARHASLTLLNLTGTSRTEGSNPTIWRE
jgi:hypothetical protein